MVGAIRVLLVVIPEVSANNLRELIAWAKANPNKLNFASTGNGSPAHLAGELFNSMAGIKAMHVPYKGTSQGTTDAIGGSIQIAWPLVSSTLQFVREGKLRALGITSPQRSSIAPDIPPIAEVLPGYQASIWNGVFAPAGTSAAIVTRLSAELNKALEIPEVKSKLIGMGFDPDPGTPQALRVHRGRAEEMAHRGARCGDQDGVGEVGKHCIVNLGSMPARTRVDPCLTRRIPPV